MIAGLVWLIAGINVTGIGVHAYQLGNLSFINMVMSLVIFGLFFYLAFLKLTTKHTARVEAYDELRERTCVFAFFDAKSYVMMVVMMALGISLRVFGVLPERAVAVFYTGLGSALMLAGVIFIMNYFEFGHKTKTKVA